MFATMKPLVSPNTDTHIYACTRTYASVRQAQTGRHSTGGNATIKGAHATMRSLVYTHARTRCTHTRM